MDCVSEKLMGKVYNGEVQLEVVYPKANQGACQVFDDVTLFKSKPDGFPTFLLVNHGDCFFTLMPWNAQKAGVASILVAKNQGEPLITMDIHEKEKANVEYLQNITIHLILISKPLGDSLKAAITDGKMDKSS
ncbi:hypothetical protein V6N13_053809 [Hibiscus sabdariffa]|uniref:PA domain-containing protein n=1 Tax=Hibiscus sabdariffa TaxID=183260 RepID=A0ABR2T7D5_9ROSI